MTKLRVIVVATLSVAAGLGSFFATRAQVPQAVPADTEPLHRWLDLSAERVHLVRQADPEFSKEAAGLSETLTAERRKLADLLEAPASTDAQVLEQVERVIAAHDALERRVARHVLAIRPYLTADQQKRLMGLCANCVRQRGDHGWRGGRGGNDGGGAGDGSRRHRGGRDS